MIELDDFFERKFETEINNKLFLRNYHFDSSQVVDYIKGLTNIPIRCYFDYITNRELVTYLTPTSVVQYSSMTDATTKLCGKFEQEGDEGFDVIEIGKMLLDDEKPRKDGAYRKYGENHVKLALEFGLVQECYDHYYLTCLGKTFTLLSPGLQTSLLRRTILRNNFIQRMIKLSWKGKCAIVDQLSFLSVSTIKRRMPNIKGLFQLIQNDEGFVDDYLENIAELQLQVSDVVTDHVEMTNRENIGKEYDSEKTKATLSGQNKVENIGVIREEMARQNKGLRVMAEALGTSTTTIQKCRDGENVTTNTLCAVAKELGYKVVLVRDEDVEQTVNVRKKTSWHSETILPPQDLSKNTKLGKEYVSQNAVPNSQSKSIDDQISSASEIIPYLVVNEKDRSVNAKATAEAAGLLYADGWFYSKNGVQICRIDVVDELAAMYVGFTSVETGTKTLNPVKEAKPVIVENTQSAISENNIVKATDILPFVILNQDKLHVNRKETAKAANITYATGWFYNLNGDKICRIEELEELAGIRTKRENVCQDENTLKTREDHQSAIIEDTILKASDILPYVVLNKDKSCINRKSTARAAGLSYAGGWFHNLNGDKICRVEEVDELVSQHINNSFTVNPSKEPRFPSEKRKLNDEDVSSKPSKGKYGILKKNLEKYFKNKKRGIVADNLQEYLEDCAIVDENNNITYKKLKRSLKWWCKSLNVHGSPFFRKISPLENLLSNKNGD